MHDNALASKFNRIKEISYKLSKMADAAGAQQISLLANDIYLECYAKQPSAKKIKIILELIQDSLNKIASIVAELNV
jgi:hypothetical protein